MPPKADKIPTSAGKAPAPATAAKIPSTADDASFQDSNALLTTLKQVIVRSIRQHTASFSPAISSMSIGLRQPQNDQGAADQNFEVLIYTPLDDGNTSVCYRRLEGYLHKLQPEEMARFIRLVKSVRAERAGGEDDRDGDELDDGGAGETPKVKELQTMLAKHVKLLADRNADVVNLERQVNEQDKKTEENEEKASQLLMLCQSIDEKNEELEKLRADNADFKEELAKYRRDPKKHPLAVLKNRDDEDDDDVEDGDDARETDDVEDDAPTFDPADDLESSFNDAEVSQKPEPRRLSTKKPASTGLPFTPMPELSAKDDTPQNRRSTRQGSKADEQPETKKPKVKDQPVKTMERHRGSGVFHYGYDIDYEAPKSINEGVDPEKIIQKGRRDSRQLKPKGSSDPETPENAATGTSASSGNTGTPSGQAIAGGPGCKQSKVPTKTLKSKNDQGSETDDDSDQGVDKPRKSIPRKKRKAELSDEEEQPATSKKPRQRASMLQPVEEEPEDEDTKARAGKGRGGVSTGSKAKLSHPKQGAERKVAQADSGGSEGGMSDPICISSAEDTDSDADDED